MNLWPFCLNQLKLEKSIEDINTWLTTLQAIENDDHLCLLAPNPIVLQKVYELFLTEIEKITVQYTNNPEYKVILQIGSRNDAPKPEPISTTEKTNATSLEIHSESNRSFAELDKQFVNNLNRKMTFQNFVEGKSNQLARAAAMNIGEDPGKTYNPLVIYAGVGLGKTHLVHAIGNQILKNNPKARVVYAYSERFVNNMVKAIRNNAMEDFKAYYRSADALLIDDIQFFAKKDRSMEEFFHTFNALFEGQKQIVLTSDTFPRDIQGIDDRLKSRFNWGLTLEIDPPDLETRVAILQKKANESKLNIPSDIAFFIAKRFRSNVRDLEGALKRLLASMHIQGINALTQDFVYETLKDQLASQDKMVSISNIKKTVADYFNLKVSDLESKKRNRSIARPRQLAMALSKELTNQSLPEIGQEFGGRDHTTVLHACKKVKELIKSTPQFEEAHRLLLRSLTS